MKNTLFFVTVLLFSLVSIAGPGGGVVVGDGGTTVYCPAIQAGALFDLYEEETIFGPKHVTLDENGSSLKDMVYTGISRVYSRFDLNEQEKNNIQTMFKSFNTLPFDPWKTEPLPFSLRRYLVANKVATPPAVTARLAREGCKLDVAVINPHAPGIGKSVRQAYKNICAYSFAEPEYCLFRKSSALELLPKSHFACLVVHEALRFLPAEKRPTDEFQLRRMAAGICTQ